MSHLDHIHEVVVARRKEEQLRKLGAILAGARVRPEREEGIPDDEWCEDCGWVPNGCPWTDGRWRPPDCLPDEKDLPLDWARTLMQRDVIWTPEQKERP